MVGVMVAALAAWVLACATPQGTPRRLPAPRVRRRTLDIHVAEYVAEVATRLRSGVAADAAWDRTAQRWGLPTGVDDAGVPRALRALPPGAAVSGARAAALLAAELGSPLADMLDACAAGLMRADENEAARRIALAGPVASARLLAALPLLGLALGTLSGANPLGQLLGGGPGTLVGLLGVALLVGGHLWTRRLVAAARRGKT